MKNSSLRDVPKNSSSNNATVKFKKEKKNTQRILLNKEFLFLSGLSTMVEENPFSQLF